jgi:hypothetical protein
MAESQTTEDTRIPLDPSIIVGENQPQKKISKHKKALLIVGAVVLGLLIVLYGIGAAFFSAHFYPNTTFNEEDISYKADDDFISEVEVLVPTYELSITAQDYDQVVKSDQIDLNIDPNKLRADALAAQNIWLWPIEIFAQHDVSDVIDADFDHAKVEELLTPSIDAYNKQATPSVDASITYNELLDMLTVEDEVYGNEIDKESFFTKIDECLAGMQDSYQLDAEVFIQPLVLADDERFKEALPAANDLISGEIELTMAEGSVSAGKVGKDLLVTWLTLDPETLMPTLDQEAVTAWADQKGAELNTVGTKRTFTRGDGQEVSVSGGVYGWKVSTADLASTLIGNVTSGNFDAIDIPCEQTADVYNGPGQRDWGAYVDIDISEQKVRYFNEKNEQLFVTDCVTGDVTKGRGTPTGLYYLRMKKSPEVLTGFNADGTKDYETQVTYWMPFIRNSIGLHDASWRSSFGGSIYKGNGSHGCVNLPSDSAKWFYDNLETNVAVLVHE